MRRLLLGLVLALSFATLAQVPSEAAAPLSRLPSEDRIIPKNLADLQALEARVRQAIKQIIPPTVGLGGGSGVIVDKDGLILTVAHVGSKANRDLSVSFADGKKAKGKTLGNYHGVDAGMAKLTDKGDWPFAPVAKADTLEVGDWVLTVGYPVSFSKGQKPPVRIGRVLRITSTSVTTDSPMMGGDSGGPTFDLQGRVIGLNSRVGSLTSNIHVPIGVYHTHWKKMLNGEDWGEKKAKARPKTELEEIETLFQPGQKSKERPSLIGRSPNERNHDVIKAAFREATLPIGDSTVRVLCDGEPVALGTIVLANGIIVTKATQLKGKIACRLADGKLYDAKKLGEDKENDLAVLRIEAKGLKPVRWRAETPDQGSLVATVGEKGTTLTVGMITNDPRQFRITEQPAKKAGDRAYLGITSEAVKEGMRVSRVTPGSAAEKAGLKVDDVIKKIGETAIKSSDDLMNILGKHKPGDKAVLLLQRGEKEEKLDAILGKAPSTGRGALDTRPPYDRWGGGPFSERRFGFGKVLPHDSLVQPLDCGGPIVDTSGRVVGVNISRALRVSTYALMPGDVEKVVKRVLAAEKDPTKP